MEQLIWVKSGFVTELMTAVGPFTSAPQVGEAVLLTGSPAFLPSGEAASSAPQAMLLVLEPMRGTYLTCPKSPSCRQIRAVMSENQRA